MHSTGPIFLISSNEAAVTLRKSPYLAGDLDPAPDGVCPATADNATSTKQ